MLFVNFASPTGAGPGPGQRSRHSRGKYLYREIRRNRNGMFTDMDMAAAQPQISAIGGFQLKNKKNKKNKKN